MINYFKCNKNYRKNVKKLVLLKIEVFFMHQIIILMKITIFIKLRIFEMKSMNISMKELLIYLRRRNLTS